MAILKNEGKKTILVMLVEKICNIAKIKIFLEENKRYEAKR